MDPAPPPAASATPDPAPPGSESLLLAFVADHEAPCPVCAYNLRGLTRPVCPECNSPLNLAVGSENAAVGPWVFGIVCFAMGAGFDGVVTLIVSVAMTMAYIFQGGPIPWQPIGIASMLAVLCALCISAVVIFVRRRPKWCRMPRRRQWFWAGVIFACVFLLHATAAGMFFLLAR